MNFKLSLSAGLASLLLGYMGGKLASSVRSEEPAGERPSTYLLSGRAGGQNPGDGGYRSRSTARSKQTGSELSENLLDWPQQILGLAPAELSGFAKRMNGMAGDQKKIAQYPFYLNWAETEPVAALDFLISSDTANLSMKALVFEQWAENDPFASAEKFATNPYCLHFSGKPERGGGSKSMAKKLVAKLNAVDPGRARQWASRLPTDLRESALKELEKNTQ